MKRSAMPPRKKGFRQRRLGPKAGELHSNAHWILVGDQVMERAAGRCEARTPACTGRKPTQRHHRRLRSQGGPDSLANLLAVCVLCHAWIHAHPAESYAAGWLLRAGQDPAVSPVIGAGES